MSEQRIELWATAREGFIRAYYRDHDLAMRMRHPDEQIVRLVEIREGEPHPDKVREITDELQAQAIDTNNRLEKAERELKAATERAEKAEKAWRYLVKTIDDANTNERARYERETAARLLAAEYGAPDDEISFENAIEVESYWQRRAMWAKRTASVLAAACFGAKEA